MLAAHQYNLDIHACLKNVVDTIRSYEDEDEEGEVTGLGTTLASGSHVLPDKVSKVKS